jgi:monoamine oxidase
MEIAKAERLAVADIGGRRWQSRGGELRVLDDFWQRLDRVMRRLDEQRDPDRSFAAALARNRSLDPRDRALAMQFVEGFHAADPAIISERALAEGGSPRGDVRERRIGRVLDGYDAIIDALAEPVRRQVQLRAVVERVEWQRGRVAVRLRGGRVVHGGAVIVTVPLGVLAAAAGERGAIEFDPPLPARHARAIGGLAMGGVVRMALRFAEPFWMSKRFVAAAGDDRLDTLSFLHGTSDADFPIWWTTYPVRSPLLVGWCGGPNALRLGGLKPGQLEGAALRSLAMLLPTTVPTLRKLLVSSHVHDWISDPFARGAYSYARVGGDDAPGRLARPVEGTIHFAGEAADPEGRTGTVHGAIATGQRAADAILR